MQRIFLFFLIGTTVLFSPVQTGDMTAAAFSPEGGEGGYSMPVRTREAINRRWSPIVDVGLHGWIYCIFHENRTNGELNEYWRAYLGLDNHVPKMDPEAKTEWDDLLEQQKIRRGLPPSEFYGTTDKMNQLVRMIADTLNLGRIVRDYDAYKRTCPGLAPLRTIRAMYRQGQWVMSHPDTWVQVGKKVGSFQFKLNDWTDPATGEPISLGMLAQFGMKWSPTEGALLIHDTYDFPAFVTLFSSIPVRPMEMKIRGRIDFNPETGCPLAACITSAPLAQL